MLKNLALMNNIVFKFEMVMVKKIGLFIYLLFSSLSLLCFSQLTFPLFFSLSNLDILPPSCRSRHFGR